MLKLFSELLIVSNKITEFNNVVRLNGTSDIPFENIKFMDGKNIFELFPEIQFYDYTKIPNRKDIPEKDLKNIKDYCITQADFGKLCFENLNNPRNVINNLIKY
jgi:hypothetical protein